jgi:molybdopterin molybdotransferase
LFWWRKRAAHQGIFSAKDCAMAESLRMASVLEARQTMLQEAKPLTEDVVSLEDGCGRVLRAPVLAMRDHPPFDSSAMDGYAVRSAETPAQLLLSGKTAAGALEAGVLPTGAAHRIFTGAPLPQGADAVAIQEQVSALDGMIVAPATPPGHHVRPRGLDFRAGATLLAAGVWLDAIALSLAAAAGADRLRVGACPRVALLAGGDEIAEAGAPLGPHQIYDSVTPGLRTLVHAWGGRTVSVTRIPDDLSALSAAMAQALAQADILVAVGGASVGERDLMKSALANLKGRLIVDGIAVRPGKPTWFAACGQGLVLGLPGNPASALVCAHLFLEPLLARMAGGASRIFTARAVLLKGLPANGPREHYLRAHLDFAADGIQRVIAAEDQDSSLLSVFQRANALIQRLPNAVAVSTQEPVQVLRIRP